MSDSTGKDGADPLAAALKRAEKAVAGSGKAGAAKPTAPSPTSFGEIDLGADGNESAQLELDPAAQAKKPAIKKPSLMQDEQWEDDGWESGKSAPKFAPDEDADPLPVFGESPQRPQRPAPTPPRDPSPAAPIAKAPAANVPKAPAERDGPFVRVTMADKPRRNWGKLIKISLIVVLAAGAIGGGVFGFIKWRESVKADEQAQLDALDQGSLDRLKADAAKRERLGS